MKNSLSIFNSVLIFPFLFGPFPLEKDPVNGGWLKHEKQNNIKLVIDCKSLRLAGVRDTFSSLTYLVLVVSGGWSGWEPGASVPRPVGEGHNTASDPALNPEGPAVWDPPENTSRV